MRHNMDYGLFRRCLTEGCDGVDETEFFILDEPEPVYCILGYLPEKLIGGEWKRDEQPYWIGHGCDVKDGLEFATAEELLHAKVYGGRSLAEVWDRVYVENLGMVPLDIWFEACPFSDEVYEENGVWKLRSGK